MKKIIASICSAIVSFLGIAILLIVGVAIIAFIGIFIISMINNPDNNDHIIIKAEDIGIYNISDYSEAYINTFERDIWDDETSEEINNNKEEYKIFQVRYTIYNCSDSIEMMDVRVHPKFGDNVDVIAYNSGNTEHYMYALPNLYVGFTQYVLINSRDEFKDDILEDIICENAELIYYTGGFFMNTGHGYKGLGKHIYKFKINDVV